MPDKTWGGLFSLIACNQWQKDYIHMSLMFGNIHVLLIYFRLYLLGNLFKFIKHCSYLLSNLILKRYYSYLPHMSKLKLGEVKILCLRCTDGKWQSQMQNYFVYISCAAYWICRINMIHSFCFSGACSLLGKMMIWKQLVWMVDGGWSWDQRDFAAHKSLFLWIE